MRYYLRNPKTKVISPSALLPPALQRDTELYGRISKMCTMREAMRERLKSQSKTDDFSRISALMSAIQAYLVELHWYVWYYENNTDAFKDMAGVDFIWKSAIVSKLHDAMGLSRTRYGKRGGGAESDGGNTSSTGLGARVLGGGSNKQRRTQSTSIYMELGFTLLALAIAKSMAAYSKVATLDTEIECETMNAMTPGAQVANKDEDDKILDALRRAALELREAAGVFQYIIDHVLPQLRGIRLGVPDLTPDIQYMLQMLSLADADRLSVRVWLRNDKHHRKTPNMPANFLLCIQERYSNAVTALRMLQSGEFRSISSDIQNYMRDGQLVILAQAMVYLAQVHSDNKKYGYAVGFMRYARDLLTEVKKRKTSVHANTAEMLLRGPLEPLYSLYRRNNDSIGFEPVPSTEELHGRLPSGRALFSSATVYVPPTILS
ncbi:hypothetical protein LPJ66_003791 [Kickxella alabastrina]|uniref:Uncharacterized protein n=1 Tax=Kickxella alabastrina TaxID=61397 RepID=A0ACC1IJC7_9FUNG|nr:hypothetical protein LPJ66_003791 [Kickxella alabastrina]